MGRPKGLLRLRDGRSLVRAHVDALSPLCDQVIVVTGAHQALLEAELTEAVRFVHNPKWQTTGPVESLALAVHGAGLERVASTPVDVPPVRPRDLEALLSARAPAVLAWQDRPGHPILLGGPLCQRLVQGPVVGGLRTLLVGATQVHASTGDVLLNLNTPAQWAAWAGSH
jgi:CTP:molybdopterin cytidylyltransferase MocA